MKTLKLEEFHLPNFHYENEEHFVRKGIDVDANCEYGDIFVVVGYLDIDEPEAVVMHGTRVAVGGTEQWRTVKTYSAPERADKEINGTKFLNVRSLKTGLEIVGGVRCAKTGNWEPIVYFGPHDGSGTWFPINAALDSCVAVAMTGEFTLLRDEGTGEYYVKIGDSDTLLPVGTDAPPVIKGVEFSGAGFKILGED